MFGRKLGNHGLLQLFDIHAIPLGGIYEQFVGCARTHVGRVEQADFEQYPAERSFVICSDALCQKLLRSLRALAFFDLVSLRQSRALGCREVADDVVGRRSERSAFFKGADTRSKMLPKLGADS